MKACPICGVHFCALFATTNAAALAEWRARHIEDEGNGGTK